MAVVTNPPGWVQVAVSHLRAAGHTVKEFTGVQALLKRCWHLYVALIGADQGQTLVGDRCSAS